MLLLGISYLYEHSPPKLKMDIGLWDQCSGQSPGLPRQGLAKPCVIQVSLIWFSQWFRINKRHCAFCSFRHVKQERVGYLLCSVAGFTGYLSCSGVRAPQRPITPGESNGSYGAAVLKSVSGNSALFFFPTHSHPVRCSCGSYKKVARRGEKIQKRSAEFQERRLGKKKESIPRKRTSTIKTRTPISISM